MSRTRGYLQLVLHLQNVLRFLRNVLGPRVKLHNDLHLLYVCEYDIAILLLHIS